MGMWWELDNNNHSYNGLSNNDNNFWINHNSPHNDNRFNNNVSKVENNCDLILNH